jgi:hypothetical protein
VENFLRGRQFLHRMQQCVLQFVGTISRTDVHQDQSGLDRSELRDQPLRAIRSPDADAIAALQAQFNQARGKLVHLPLELRICPADALVTRHQRSTTAQILIGAIQTPAFGIHFTIAS